jgi:hypothetical protein
MASISTSPLDCLGLPDDITRRMEVFHANPICSDKYFKYCENKHLYDKMCDRYRNPYMLLDMYASHLMGEFHTVVRTSNHPAHDLAKAQPTELAARLAADGGIEGWGNSSDGWNVLVSDVMRSALYLPDGTGKTFDHVMITKWRWLLSFVSQCNDFGGCNFLKHVPNITIGVPVNVHKNLPRKSIQALLDRNNIPYFKSWSKTKLINAWYKSE